MFIYIESRPECGNIASLTVDSKSINAQHLHESCDQPNVKFNYKGWVPPTETVPRYTATYHGIPQQY